LPLASRCLTGRGDNVKRPEPETGRRQLFDDWPERYDRWFETPIGRLVGRYERDLVMDLLHPAAGERILDAGCGTGIFTLDFLRKGAAVTGLDLSMPMLQRAAKKASARPFRPVRGDMLSLPFANRVFDKTVSVTALEFMEDGASAVRELFRVTRKGGLVVVATLNSLSPWADRRRERAAQGQSEVFKQVTFRGPEETAGLGPAHGEWRTAIHFGKDEDPARAPFVEEAGRIEGRNTGAFLAVRWFV